MKRLISLLALSYIAASLTACASMGEGGASSAGRAGRSSSPSSSGITMYGVIDSGVTVHN